MPSPRAEAPILVNVNSHRLRGNRKAPEAPKAPIVARRGRNGRPSSCFRVEIVDAAGVVVAEVVYEPRTPLKCGAEVFVTCKYDPKYQLFPSPDQLPAAASAGQSTRARRARSTGRPP